jgi:hypothetical protein
VGGVESEISDQLWQMPSLGQAEQKRTDKLIKHIKSSLEPDICLHCIKDRKIICQCIKITPRKSNLK